MNPGPKLDETIAQIFFPHDGHDMSAVLTAAKKPPYLPFSTDINAAWEVVEKLQSAGWQLKLMKKRGGWTASFVAVETGTEVPHAICLAALRTVKGTSHSRE